MKKHLLTVLFSILVLSQSAIANVYNDEADSMQEHRDEQKSSVSFFAQANLGYATELEMLKNLGDESE